MVDRIQLTQPCYMQLDGQWQIVDIGSVIDVPSGMVFASPTVARLSPTEAAGALASHGKPTSVRSVRTR